MVIHQLTYSAALEEPPYVSAKTFKRQCCIGHDPIWSGSQGHSELLLQERPLKGVLAWTDEDTIIVIGAGIDARWEKFDVEENILGHRRGPTGYGLDPCASSP
ncbi:hypothetical protein F5883DRAFT_668598 [Diaporthe sp. PMI_573]|nr:hypothetical protein F5883DRAFT_668598 [Diaporthaceae sp. PMI_573]